MCVAPTCLYELLKMPGQSASDAPIQHPLGVKLDLGQEKESASQWQQFLRDPGTHTVPHEAGHSAAPGGTQDPLHQSQGLAIL